jgi:DNA-directed RNA polymerase specialized sigma24 family protein
MRATPAAAPAPVRATPHDALADAAMQPDAQMVRGELHVKDFFPNADALIDAAQPKAETRAVQLASEGYSAREIAGMIDANVNTVRSWLRRASAKQNGGTHA